jgi:hypothetical protein
MAGSVGLGFNKNDSSQTGRQGSNVAFPKQFLLDMNQALGGPFTTGDLFRLAPQPHSLFGYGPTKGQQPGGSFALGFGPPTGSLSAGDATAGQTTQPGVPTTTTTTPGTGDTSTTATPGKTYTISDLQGAYFNDPDKVMDLPRLFRQAGLDPNSFTADEFQNAVGNAKKYGFSGRSQGLFSKALGSLQQDTKIDSTLGGKTGTGVF